MAIFLIGAKLKMTTVLIKGWPIFAGDDGIPADLTC